MEQHRGWIIDHRLLMAQPMRRCLKGIVTLYRSEGGEGDTSKINRRHCQLRVKCALALSILVPPRV